MIARWRLHFAAALLIAVATHLLAVWALPRVIMDRIITLGGGDARAQGTTGVYLPPPTDHTQRRIVMPSPDLLYATCAFDLRNGPLRVTLQTDYPRYWSIALYASTSDNFHVVNDRKAVQGIVDFTVVGPSSASSSSDAAVVAPTSRGFLLLRLLVNDDPQVRAAAEATRRRLRCTQRSMS